MIEALRSMSDLLSVLSSEGVVGGLLLVLEFLILSLIYYLGAWRLSKKRAEDRLLSHFLTVSRLRNLLHTNVCEGEHLAVYLFHNHNATLDGAISFFYAELFLDIGDSSSLPDVLPLSRYPFFSLVIEKKILSLSIVGFRSVDPALSMDLSASGTCFIIATLISDKEGLPLGVLCAEYKEESLGIGRVPHIISLSQAVSREVTAVTQEEKNGRKKKR